MDSFGMSMTGVDFKVMVCRGATFAEDSDGNRPTLQHLNFSVEAGGDVEVHSTDGFHCLVQQFEFPAGQIIGESVFALPVAGLQEFLKLLPVKASKMKDVTVGFSRSEGDGNQVRIAAFGGGMAEPVETFLDVNNAQFPHLEEFFKSGEEMEFKEDVGRVSLAAWSLYKMAMLAKPIKWAYGLDTEQGNRVAVRLSYSQNESSPVMFNIEGGEYPVYGLAMPMFVQWETPKGN